MYIRSNFIESHRFTKKFEKFKNIPFSFFFDYKPSPAELQINPINIFAHDEPNEYFGHHDWLKSHAKYFSLILTWNTEILHNNENARLLIFGESWVDKHPDIESACLNKIFDIAFIRGEKLLSYGHQIRHEVYNRRAEVLIPNRFFPKTDISSFEKLIEGKLKVHGPSMFSLVIENTSHDNYFTEKITDAIMLKSIPIYWGCSNIEEFYDPAGLICVRTADEAIRKINTLTPEYYTERLDVINKNAKLATSYANYISRIYDILEETFTLNGYK